MINRTLLDDDFLGLDTSMRGPVVASTILHIAILVLSVIGLPFVIRNHEVISQPVSVEIVPISELTQTNRVAEPVKPKEEKELPPPKQEKPAPPKMDAPSPPDMAKPTPPDIPEAKPVESPPVAPLALPKPEKKADVKPKDKPKPPKPDQTKVEKKQEQDFSSLLKNLAPDVKNDKSTEDAPKTAKDSAQQSAVAPLSDRLTMSEMDALRHQLGQCWNLGASAGGAYAEELKVDVSVTIGPDRIVQQAQVVDMGRYNRDSAFRAAADAALRALRNPQCTPLQLPPDKYDQWKDTTITFDPSDML